MTETDHREEIIAAHKRGQVALTAELARLYLASEPGDRTVQLIHGDALTHLGRTDDALQSLGRALALSAPADRASALRLLGHVHNQCGALDDAERCYRDAVDAAPAHASAYVYLGALLARRGKLDAALEVLTRGTACVDGVQSEVQLNIGLVHRTRGDYLAARARFQEAIRLDPEYEDAQEVLADVERLLLDFPLV